ncbi:tRNA lysidine(34) synthetase TilS [Lentibacillus salicampi]|uniref:tRNA(Ile)-lysidine synthase n=1 Tax=Lentibacillus salicampi TaxID=175306 RepID=A0A4Y9AC31_9BACI|nr:tRNA lysidine(34) synthetase TilS [Lentibacillus salicampi]TFJ92985.1 tRNA lysidine(34) synthetase TilS [Lentibacillus salicampi]
MDNTVRAFMKRHQLVKEHATVLIAVSGGPDSMALLHFFWKHREEWRLRLIAVSVDHQLRGEESLEDLDYVRQFCRKRNIEFIGTSLDVPAYKQEKQIGTQIAARELRYQFLAEQMTTYDADYLALGHHGDDQAETVLMGLVHSASVKSLAGMPLERDFATGKIIRPFLCVTKETIEHYCRKHAITPRRDPSNDESTYTRNDYRNNVLPLLKSRNPNLHRTIQHLSRSLQEDEAFLEREVEKMVKQAVTFDKQKTAVHFNIGTFNSYPHSLQRRAFHLILNYLYSDIPKKISYVHEVQFFTILNDRHGNVRIDFPHRLKLERSYQNISLYFMNGKPEPLSYHMLIALPGETVLPNGGAIAADVTSNPGIPDDMVYVCDKETVALPLHIRTRKPGDRLRWRGMNGSKKVKDIFIDAKIPLNERDTWPVVTDNNDDILWLIGLKKGMPRKQAENGSYIQLSFRNSDA